MIKKFLLLAFSLFSLHLRASAPPEQLMVVLYRGTVSSVVIDTEELEATLSPSQAINLVGTGENRFCLGRINMLIYNNTDSLPYKLDLLCNTYNSTNNEFVAVHTDQVAELTIGIEKNFNLAGQRTAYALIDPTSDTTLLRESSATICPAEEYTLHFYILQSPHNIFVGGTYTGRFVLFFQS